MEKKKLVYLFCPLIDTFSKSTVRMAQTSLGSRNLFRLLKPRKQQPSSAAAFRHLCSEPKPTETSAQSDIRTSSVVKAVSLQTAKPDHFQIDLSPQIVSLLQNTNPEDWASSADLRQLLFGSPAINPLTIFKITRQLGSYERSFQFFNFFKNNRVDESSAISTPPSPKAVAFAFEGVLQYASREEGANAPVKLKELFIFAREQNVPLSSGSATLLIKELGRVKMFEEAVAAFNAVEPYMRNATVANALLSLMLMGGRVDDALKLIDEMLESKLDHFPNRNTLDIMLSQVLSRNWSGRNLKEEEISQLVIKLMKNGVFPSSIWLTQTITMFCRFGRCDRAWDLVHELMRLGGKVDTVPCNALMTGLIKEQDFQRMNLLMKEMKEKNIQPDVVTYGILINHLCKIRRVDEAIEVLEKMKVDAEENGGISVEPDVVLYNTLIDGLCKVGRQEEALVLMEKMKSEDGCSPTTSTYNTIMDGFCKVGEIDRSFELFNQMNNEGVIPNVITYNTLIDGMCKCGRVSSALQLLNEMLRTGMKANATTYTVLITAFCNVNNIEKAMKLFDQMLESGTISDATVYHSLISGLSQAGRMDDACFVVSQMRAAGFRLDLIGYNVLIGGLCRKSKFDKAYELFKSMKESGVNPDRVTYNTLIAYFSEKEDLETALIILKKMRADMITPNVVTYGALIKSCCKSGNLDEAMKIYKDMNIGSKISSTMKPNTIIYNTLINALCKSDKVELALNLLGDMKEMGVRPDTSTFNSLLKGLEERRCLDKAFKLMNEMNEQACSPDYVTMEILTEWLPAVGQTEKLQAFVQGYKVSPSPSPA